MTIFKPGDWAVPKDEEQKDSILRQSDGLLSFPCKVLKVVGRGREEFLSLRISDVQSVGLYAYRFKHHTLNKPLEDYL